MLKRSHLFAALVGVCVAPLLGAAVALAQVVGIPQFVQNLTVRGTLAVQGAQTSAGLTSTGTVTVSSTGPVYKWIETDAAADGQRWRDYVNANILNRCVLNDAEGVETCYMQTTRSGTTITAVNLAATAIQGNGVNMTPLSGTFTASYTNACSTTPTQSIRYYKIGNLVTLTAAAAFTCTSDTTTFDTDSSDVPSAIRPVTSNAYSANFGAQNNTASATAMIEINGGEIIINRCGAVTGTCDGGAWSNIGTKGLDAWTFSYVIQ
jgi:hypothetical protein